MARSLDEIDESIQGGEENFEAAFSRTYGSETPDYMATDTQLVPEGATYSVTDFENDASVINAFELVTDHLAANRGVGSAILDTATSGKQTDVAEFMRDDVMRISSKFAKANILEDAPEEVKAAYRLMQDRWESSSLTGAGETFEAVKDYAGDVVFNPETLGAAAAALFTKGKSVPGEVARRTASKTALNNALKASQTAATNNPLVYSSALGAVYGGADNLAVQELDISLDKKSKINVSDAIQGAGIGAVAGAGLYGATRLGAKYLSKGTDISDDIPPTPEMFDEADLPESATTLVKDIDNLVVDPSSVYGAGIYNPDKAEELLSKVDTINVEKFVEDIGGGEKTKAEVRNAIRLAISQETTVDGVQNRIKQETFKIYSNLSGNLFGKAAGVLSPLTKLSGTAKVLQAKLSYEFGVGFKNTTKVLEKDLSEVQRQVTGGFNDQFMAIVEEISIHSSKGTLAKDTNDLLMLAIRSNDGIGKDIVDENTAKTINKAAEGIRKLYRDMGEDLQQIGVIDRLVDNYIPRMWDRKAIEANPEKLAALLEKQEGWKGEPGSGMQTVEGMLNIKDQIDAGGAGGHFFSAKRKLNEIENDADFQEFLNEDVLGALNAYTFQAGKSIAKHRVLGVNNLSEFQKLWSSRIQREVAAKGERMSESDVKQIDLLYKTATGEGMERYGKKVQAGVDTYGFVNRVAMLGLATLSSLTEVFINFSKAGVVNSVKGFGEALEISYKGITGDLTDQLKTNNGLTTKEAFSEMRKMSIAMDQAMAQQGNRLAGDDLMNETLQNASNKFFRVTLLDQWTKFVQTTSYASGKNLINENIEALAANGGRLTNKKLESQAGELAELGIDYQQGIKWFNEGSKKTDNFYDDQLLGGAARYSNSVVLQPTAMSGLKPLLYSNPKTAIMFQLLGYPMAFTNTVLKGAAKAIIKDPSRNAAKTLATGVIMTEMARFTNYARTGGKSEEGKSWDEIHGAALARWGGNGILLDMFQRARESSKYTKNSAPYFMMPFGPAGSDLLKFHQQGIIPTVGSKVPFISGTYGGKTLLGEWTVHEYKQKLRQFQREYISDVLVKKEDVDKTLLGFEKGGKVSVPNAPVEPDERVDKITGQPYNQQAGSAFMDETDPFKVLMNKGGQVPRKMYMAGGTVVVGKAAAKGLTALAETISNKVENLFNKETVANAASNIDDQIDKLKLNRDNPDLEVYVEALIDDNLEANTFRSLSELKEVPAYTKAMENENESIQGELLSEAQTALGMSETKKTALETINRLQSSVDPDLALSAVVPNSLGNLSSEYKRVKPNITPEEIASVDFEKFKIAALQNLDRFLKKTISENSEGLSEEGVATLAEKNAAKLILSSKVDLNKYLTQRYSNNILGEEEKFSMLSSMVADDEKLQKVFKNSELLDRTLTPTYRNSSNIFEVVEGKLENVFLNNELATFLTKAGYDPKGLNDLAQGLVSGKEAGVTFSNKSPIGFYSLAEKVAKELDRKQGTGEEWVKELTAKGVKEDELNWTGFIEQFTGSEQGEAKITKNEVTKFLKKNRLDVEESQVSDDFSSYTVRGKEETKKNNYRTVLLTLPKNKETSAGPYVSEEHYDVGDYIREDVENLLVHLRFSDHKRGNKKNLILEEYQSDVHMAGEKEGYADINLPKQEKSINKQDAENQLEMFEDLQEDLLKLYDLDEETILPFSDEDLYEFNAMFNTNLETEKDIENLMAFYDREMLQLINVLNPTTGVPQMPFKTKGKRGGGWRELGARRALIEAAKGDYDNLIITTGEEQFKRYGESFDPTALEKNYDKVLVSLLNNFGEKYKKEVKDIESNYVDSRKSSNGRMRLFPLTPEMKEDILRGLPQFYAGGVIKRRAYKEGGEVEYEIQSGDTLSEIAKDRGTTVDQLAASNKIADVNKIYAGQKLIIPTAPVKVEPEPVVQLEPEKPSTPLSQQVSNVYSGVKNTLSENANRTTDKIESTKNSLAENINAVSANAGSAFIAGVNATTGVASDLSNQVTDVIQNTATGTNNAISSFEDQSKSVLKSGANSVAEAMEFLGTQGQESVEAVQGASTNLGNQVQQSFENADTKRRNLEAQQREAVTQSVKNVSNAATAASDQVSETFGSIVETTGKGVTALKNLLSSGVDSVKSFEVPDDAFPNRLESLKRIPAPKIAETPEVIPAPNVDPEFPTKIRDSLYQTVVPTSVRAFAKSFVDSGVWDETIFTKKEIKQLKKTVTSEIKRGRNQLNYSDYEGPKQKVGYGMEIPDLLNPDVNLKFTLGTAAIVRSGNEVIVADEYDIGVPGGIGEQGQLEKLQYLKNNVMGFLSGDLNSDGTPKISFYGLAHRVAEAYGANPGSGPSVRASVGTFESLGVTEEQFNKLPTLESYRKNQVNRIKQRPIRQFLKDIGVPIKNV